MKKEGNWSYSAPDVPMSHWVEQGHDGAYAHHAERLIQSIKDNTLCLRSNSSDEVAVVGESNLILPPTLH